MERVYQVRQEKSKPGRIRLREVAIPLPLPVATAVGEFSEAGENFCAEAGLRMVRGVVARRGGHQGGSLVVFGQKVPIWRERIQDLRGKEVPLERYRLFQSDGRMQR